MIVAFVTMLLGLTAGIKTIEVAVAEPVARVEILLDGAAVGEMTAEPWKLDVDLGSELLPHQLLAIARDSDGLEIGRAAQWINLPHQPVEAQLLLSREGSARSARLIWSAVDQIAPEEITLSFDGELLEVPDPERILLPEHDSAEMHFLRAELRFSSGALAVAEAAFGGHFGEYVATEIQALALALDKRQRLPALAELSDWLEKHEESLVVRAVDAGPAEVVMVVDLGARGALAALQETNIVHRPAPPPRRERADPNLPGYTPQAGPRRRARSKATQRIALPPVMHARDRLRFVYPARPTEPYAIFPISAPFTPEQGGLFDLLTRVNLPAEAADTQRLADAVAVAGLHAYGGHRRRIVVLVLGEEAVDRSRFRLPLVRRYLSSLRVPLAVWWIRGSASSSDLSPPLAGESRLVSAERGPAAEISSIKALKAALTDLRRELDAQRIFWVEGHHLPQNVRLTSTAEARWAGDS